MWYVVQSVFVCQMRWLSDMYFFGYKLEVFPFQNNPKNLDPSYKMDLEFWDCFGRTKTHLITEIHKTYFSRAT